MYNRWEIRARANLKRREIRARAIAYLGGKCKICGYSECLEAFDAHHVDAISKDFNISSVSSWPRLEKELKKCVLLCSRCHREVHAGLHPEYLAVEDPYGAGWGDGED